MSRQRVVSSSPVAPAKSLPARNSFDRPNPMPGIVGIIEKGRQPDSVAALEQMVNSLFHERTFVSGTVSVEKPRAHLGWVCRAGSFSDCLPIWNESRKVCLIFVGEHFSDTTAAGNARNLMSLYEELGDAFLSRLNGVFSGVLVNLRDSKVILFNDRYGLGRLYFHENDEAYYFASEAKALLKVDPSLRALDPVALAEFFACGCPLENRSLFPDVRLVPGGAAWTWRPGRPLVRSAYFDPTNWESQTPLVSEDYYQRLKEVFTRIVPRYFEGRQQVAMSITGGADSRMIMAALRPAPASVKCYTFGGTYRKCADVRIGSMVASAAGQTHDVLPISMEFFSQFPELAAKCVFLTDGLMDVTGAANLYLNRLACSIAPIRITGNYGGEILRGLSNFKFHEVDESLFEPSFVPLLRQAKETLKSSRKCSHHTFIAFKQVPWHHYAMFAAEQSQVTVRTPYLDNEIVALSYQSPPELRNKNLAFRYVADTDARLASVPNDRGAVWQSGVGLDRSRSRLCTLREEFLPKAEYLFDYGMPNWLVWLERAIAPLRIERLFLGHQKFCHFRLWYRRELAGFVQAVLLDDRSMARTFLNRRRIEQIVSSHVRGLANNTAVIHKLLSCELLHRTFIDHTRG